MGGELTVNSVLGGQGCFSFTVPLQVPHDVPVDFAPLSRSDLKGLKALVVDDNHVALQIMSGMLEGMGWHPVVADGADAAVALVRRASGTPNPFDIIFLDWDMPGKTAWPWRLNSGKFMDRELPVDDHGHGQRAGFIAASA